MPWLKHPLLVWLGQISFCVYLTHAAIICSFGTSVANALEAMHVSSWCVELVSILAIVSCTLAVSTVFHRFVDMPPKRSISAEVVLHTSPARSLP